MNTTVFKRNKKNIVFALTYCNVSVFSKSKYTIKQFLFYLGNISFLYRDLTESINPFTRVTKSAI